MADKVVVKREVEAFLEPDPAVSVFTPESIGLDPGMTLAEWVTEQDCDVSEGVKDLDLDLNPTIHLALREIYDDGSRKVVENFVWRDHGVTE